MHRRQFIRTASGVACLGLLGIQPATASTQGTLVNAQVTASGAIVATDNDFVIAGQHITVAGGTFYQDAGNSYVIYNNGYSGQICDNTLTVTDVAQISSPNATFGIRIDGGDVAVTNNTIAAADSINKRFIATGFFDGAKSLVDGNSITGAHRVGVLAVGAGTDLTVSNNEIVGPGPRTDGWADNGIQLSGGATGSVKNNTVTDHWYALNTFVSSGLIIFGDEVVVQRNDFADNDLAIACEGARNNIIQNTVTVGYEETDTFHYGIIEYGGEDNGIRQNELSTAADANGYAGIYVLGDNTKLIRNSLTGWQFPIVDQGEDTKLPKPFDPEL